MDFTNKVVLITGACSGIGAATAVHFAKYSAKLALAGQNEKNLQETASKCEIENGIKPLTIIADITIAEDVDRIMKQTIDYFSKLDILVNNAGIGRYATIQTTSLEMYNLIMNTNLRGAFHLTTLAVPHLIKTKGCIVNVSSASSLRPQPRLLVYSMSKAAIDQFTRSLAYGLGPDGVRVNSVNPGYVPTGIMKNGGLNEAELDAITKKVKSKTPLGRLNEASDVANLILFLASDLSKTITGTINPIDGGFCLV